MTLMYLLCVLLTPSDAAADPLAPLQALAGDWQLTFLQIDPTGTYREVGTSTSHISLKLDGKLVHEETVIKTDTDAFPLVVQYSYDRVRATYRKVSTDGVTGLMDIQEGRLIDGVLLLDNTRHETWFVGKSGKELGFRIALNLTDPDHPLMTADLSSDKGRTWQKFQQVVYTRLSPHTAATP